MFFKLEDLEVENKNVLVRADFNVPLDEKGNITDDKRIKSAIPTIEYLISKKAMIILCSHLGKPKGEIVEKLKMDKVAVRLQELLGQKIYKLDDCIGNDIIEFTDKMVPGEVVLLENLRFYPEEKKGDHDFASDLADIAEIFVLDAFGTAHREHASIVGIPYFIKSAAGRLLVKEIETLGKVMENPKKPFVAIMGGLKVSDKIKAIKNLLKKVDYLLIGGAMANTFLAAKGEEMGSSFVEEESISLAKELMKDERIILPTDLVITETIEEIAPTKIVKEVMEGWKAVDIGPESVENFKKYISKASTIIWNGTMGVSEFNNFAKGTEEIAKALVNSKAITIVGGGDTAGFLESKKLVEKMTHVSTGGGASLMFFEGEKLPGIKALENNYKKFS